jgi:hypothetical protein
MLLDLIEPAPRRREGVEVQFVNADAGVVLDAIFNDEPGFAQNAQMPAQRRRTHFDALRQLPGAQRPAQQLANDRAPSGVRECREGGVEIDGGRETHFFAGLLNR